MTSSNDLTGTRVLVVDDDDEVAAICLLVLGTSGAVAESALDAEKAKSRLALGDIDLLVTDLVMPGLTGRRFLDWLEETHPLLPVVVMSGVPDQVQAAAARPNVRAVLDKPFTVTAILEAAAAATAAPAR